LKITIVAVGKPGRLLADAIQEYERRAGRYWKLASVTVRAETATKNRPADEVMAAEAERLLAAAEGSEIIALTPAGKRWSSKEVAARLEERALQGGAPVAFVIGGAYGLHSTILQGARETLSLSDMTMPHDLARLVLAEQLYRAGTIQRGEPYHKD
jgi:23S rRNA (pseudouridine1915-N3)-methyltransferase